MKGNDLEIETKKGDAVKAMFDGTVRLSTYISGHGNVIVVRHHNGLETVYAHNAQNLVKVGQDIPLLLWVEIPIENSLTSTS